MDVKEGFLCPICMADLGDVIQLQVHFDEEHSKEDPAVVKNLKDFFGKIKGKIADELPRLASSESASEIASILSPTSQTASAAAGLIKRPSPNRGEGSVPKVNVYGTEYQAAHHPVSGISIEHLEEANNQLPNVSLMSSFRQERSRRADMLAMDTNKLVIRLEKLMTSLPVHDPVKRRAHEQAVVPWAPEDVVNLCPNCAKSFNLTRRRHHCRLCGSIMCNDCSHYVDFDLANKIISQSGLKDDSPGAGDAVKKKAVDELVSKMADFAGLTESQCRFRTCFYCLETLRKREARARIKSDRPAIVFYYGKLRELMEEGAKMSSEYQAMAAELNAGEGAQTKHKIDDAKVLRVKLLKMAEAVDAVSKRVVGLDLGEDDDSLDPVAMGSYATLKSRIRIASVNFVKETLVGLPGIPTEEELARLQEVRRREASLRVEEEKKQSALAKLKFDSAKRQQPSRQQQQRAPGKRPPQPVKFDSGFVSSLSRNNYVSSDDPIVQQMCNLREFIGQAKAAGRHDDARLLEENLKDLQEEYQRQRSQLEENYESYRHIFEASSSADREDTGDGGAEDDDDDVPNPFDDATEDEIASIESVLDKTGWRRSQDLLVPAAAAAGKSSPSVDNNGQRKIEDEDELERQTIRVGSADFDEYDASGKNPFF